LLDDDDDDGNDDDTHCCLSVLSRERLVIERTKSRKNWFIMTTVIRVAILMWKTKITRSSVSVSCQCQSLRTKCQRE